MIRLALNGNAKEAYEIHFKLMDVIDYIFEENNPAGIKSLLKKIGICGDQVRLPLVIATENLQVKIASFIDNY